MQEVYRVAASMLLLRPVKGEAGCYEILLLHKPRKRDAWQLPQGGMEAGETVSDAALRELKEEAGITGIEVLGQGSEVYQYDFPESYRRFRPDNVCGQRITFVFALADPDTPVQVDGKEVDRFVWIEPHALGRYLKRKEYNVLINSLLCEALERISS